MPCCGVPEPKVKESYKKSLFVKNKKEKRKTNQNLEEEIMNKSTPESRIFFGI